MAKKPLRRSSKKKSGVSVDLATGGGADLTVPAAPFQLADLYLSDASVSRTNLRNGPPPPHLTINLELGFGSIENQPNQLAVRVALSAGASHHPDGPPVITINAAFVIVYLFPNPAPEEWAKEWLALVGHKQAVYHAWPYWREFVQSATSRMGLPVLRMPLIMPAEIKFDIQQPADKSQIVPTNSTEGGD
jgi:hypothetical protein